MSFTDNMPVDYPAGLEFNYSLWTADTDITLCNVAWNNDYRDVVYFDTTAELNAYLDSMETENVNIASLSYAKADEPIRIDVPFNVANRFNYVRVYNPAQPLEKGDRPAYFYYFISGVRYIAPNTTEIIVQLDIWQTWIRFVEFGNCYIERSHIGIANEDSFRDYGREYLTVPEGFDTGTDYVVMSTVRQPLMNLNSYGVLAISNINFEVSSYGTVNAPNLVTSPGSFINGVPSGAMAYYWNDGPSFFAFLRQFSDKPWMTQGIMSITIVPQISRYGVIYRPNSKTGGMAGLSRLPARFTKLWPGWRDRARNLLPRRYRHLSKFITSPYTIVELSINNGSPVILKPESWNSEDADIIEKAGYLPPNQRVTFMPRRYNGRFPATATQDANDADGDYLDTALSLSAFPSVPIVNDAGVLALANSARSMANAYNSVDWSNQKSLAGNQLSYDHATAAINLGNDQLANSQATDAQALASSNRFATDSQLTNSLMSGGSSVAGAAIGGPVAMAGAAISSATSGMFGIGQTQRQNDQNTQQLAIRQAGQSNAQALTNNNSAYVRDTNKSLADWAANGDYSQAIAGINAKAQDMRISPPSVVTQYGGETMNLIHGDMNLSFRIKMIDAAAIRRIGEYWLRYGYAVNTFGRMPRDFAAMSRFTYWKLTETYIKRAAMPESFKQSLRGILEKGVTVWRNARDIGSVDIGDNVPLPGIRLDAYSDASFPIEQPPEIVAPITPETITRKRRKMIVFSVSTPTGIIYALAGSSPGNAEVNWIETDSEVRSAQFRDATGQASAVTLTETEFAGFRDLYRSPLNVSDSI